MFNSLLQRRKDKNIWSFLILLLSCLSSFDLISKFNFVNQYSSVNVLGVNSQLILEAPVIGFSGTLNLKDNAATTVSATSTMNTLAFVNGVLNTGQVSAALNATFDPTGTDGIVLNDGDYLDVKSGLVLQSVSIAAGATASILGQPRFASSLTLTSSLSVLKMGISTELTQTASGAGTLFLLDDLSVGQGVLLPSIIQQNGKTLTFFGGSQTVAYTNTTGGVIELQGYTSLSALWTIGTGADVYNINGNGAVLDLSGTGGITFNGTTLYLNDVTIRGLQTANSLKGSGRIIMSNVTLELAGNLTRSDGSYTFYGETCKLITNGSLFTISGSGNEILVDGIVLLYDQLDGTGSSPFATASSAQINYSNGGRIQSTAGGSANLLVTGTTYTMASNFALTGSSAIQVQNTNTASPKNVTISGAGHAISFPNQAGSFFALDGNVQLTLSDVVLKDFNPAAISYGTSSSLTFGDGVRIELGPYVTIGSSDKAWNFNGNAEIDASGGVLAVNMSQGITTTGAKTLTIKNARMEVSTVNGVKALGDSTVLALQNVDFVMKDAGYTFDKGNLSILGNVSMSGGAIGSNPATTFSLTTKGNVTIGDNAMLTIDPNLTFFYNVDGSSDVDAAAKKRHIVLSYPGSVLNLNGCKVQTSSLGFALDSGTLQVKDRVLMTINTTAGAEVEFGSNLRVNLSAGAVLDIDGPLKYIP